MIVPIQYNLYPKTQIKPFIMDQLILSERGWWNYSPLREPFDDEVELEVAVMIQRKTIEAEPGHMAVRKLKRLSIMGIVKDPMVSVEQK